MTYKLLAVFFSAFMIMGCTPEKTRATQQAETVQIAEDKIPTSEYTLLFFTGDWCPPCKMVKAYLKAENKMDHVIITLDGVEQRVNIVQVDVPNSEDEDRIKRGALVLNSGDINRPFVPQFHVVKGEKLGDTHIDAFLFPWPEVFLNGGDVPADFIASEALARRIEQAIAK